jgi:ubiquinone/menaquinone biosynthesis C-methylase UbiE
MDTPASTPVATPARPVVPDLAAVKSKQRTAWSAGDYAVVGTTLQIVGESLCEAVDLRAGEKVLDVAAGNGNATLAAARRFGDVVSTDYVPELLERARVRAAAEALAVDFREADAEDLPFADGEFDVVLSSFGVMFTPDQPRAAAELARVCRPGGRIGLANWTPSSLIGQVFATLGRYLPPAPGVVSPAKWGTEAHLRELFGERAASIAATPRHFVFRYRTPEHWLDVMRTYYGPMLKAFAALDPDARRALEADLLALARRHDRAGDGTLVAPSEYLEVVVTRA